MTLTRVHDVIAFGSRGFEDLLDRLDRSASQAEVVAHLVHITTRAAEVCLHVDDQEGRVFRAEVTIVGPGIRISFDVGHGSDEIQIACDEPNFRVILRQT